MAEFNDSIARGATTTLDITYADLKGANLGQRPDLLLPENRAYRTPDNLLWSVVAGQLVPLSNAVPYVLEQCGLPMIVPSSGTFAANGALSGLTAMPFTVFPQPAYLFFPAGAVFAGSLSGLYYATLLTATTATVFNNRYVTETPTVPILPTAIVAAGPGVYTQVLAAVTLGDHLLPANTIGANGALQIDTTYLANVSAGSRAVGFGVGSVVTGSAGLISSTSIAARCQIVVATCGVPGRISVNHPTVGANAGAPSATTLAALNLTVNQRMTFTVTLFAATDFVVLASTRVTVFPG